MAETTVTNRFLLKFNSGIGRVVSFSIPRACMDMTSAEAQASMQAIIGNGVVFTGAGIPASIKTAKRITTERRPIV
jgi:hypothetical protein